MTFKAAQNITEQIADHLAGQIVADKLAGGERIQELKVADELGVSRGSVREALLILERRHLIQVVPRKGAVVNEITAEEGRDLLEMLAAAERQWYRRYIRRRDKADTLQQAAASVAAMEQAARQSSVDALVGAREEFYVAVVSETSRYLRGVFDCLLPSSHRLLRRLILSDVLDPHDIARYYKALYAALDAGDEERLMELLNAFSARLENLCGKQAKNRPKKAVFG